MLPVRNCPFVDALKILRYLNLALTYVRATGKLQRIILKNGNLKGAVRLVQGEKFVTSHIFALAKI